MKGAQQIVTSILLTGILISVVTAVTAIGLPLLDKTRDASVLENSKNFMISLEQSIKNIANNGGRARIPMSLDSHIYFDPSQEKFEMKLLSSGTIFDSETDIPLGRNDCGLERGEWQDDSPITLCVRSVCIDNPAGSCRRYSITYTLEPVLLDIGQTVNSRKIQLESEGNQLGSADSFIVLEKLGDEVSSPEKKTRVKLTVET